MIEKAKQFIEEYHLREFEYTAKSELAHLFHDLRRVPLAYTTAETPDEQAIQVCADLVNRSIDTFVDGRLAKTERYTPEDFLAILGNLEFDELVALSEDELKTVDNLIADATARSKAGVGSGLGKHLDSFGKE